MKRSGSHRVFFGLRWDGGSWDRVPVWCDALLPLLKDLPAHWCFPCPPPGGLSWAEEAFIRPLRDRLEAGKDTVVTGGFSGAPHPLLSVDELEKELSWSLKNPWLTGAADILGIRPSIIVPTLPDLERPAALRGYEAAGFKLVGVPGNGPIAPRRFKDASLFTYVPIGYVDGPPGAVLRSIRHAIGRGESFLMVDLPSFPTTRSTTAFLQELIRSVSSMGVAPSVLEPSVSGAERDDSASPPDYDRGSICSYATRARIALASGYRSKKRRKLEEYRKVLTLLSPQNAVDPKQEAESRSEAEKKKPRKKQLLAHMHGDVTLAGKAFDVKLSAGRFCGISSRDSFILPNIPSSSSITIGGKTYGYRTISSVSFEEEDGTGLRAELAGECPAKGGLIIEYAFLGENPELRISATVSYPSIAAEQFLDGSAPLVFVLQELQGEEPARLSAVCPDGSESSHRISEKNGWRPVPAMRWSVGGDGRRIVLSCAGPQERKWGLCCFRVARVKGRRVLEANPFGSLERAAGDAIGGRTESFALFIGIEKGSGGA